MTTDHITCIGEGFGLDPGLLDVHADLGGLPDGLADGKVLTLVPEGVEHADALRAGHVCERRDDGFVHTVVCEQQLNDAAEINVTARRAWKYLVSTRSIADAFTLLGTSGDIEKFAHAAPITLWPMGWVFDRVELPGAIEEWLQTISLGVE